MLSLSLSLLLLRHHNTEMFLFFRLHRVPIKIHNPPDRSCRVYNLFVEKKRALRLISYALLAMRYKIEDVIFDYAD